MYKQITQTKTAIGFGPEFAGQNDQRDDYAAAAGYFGCHLPAPSQITQNKRSDILASAAKAFQTHFANRA